MMNIQLPAVDTQQHASSETKTLTPEKYPKYHVLTKYLEMNDNLAYIPNPEQKRRTKIICTIGPASANVETIKKMIQAGMDCTRLNFSHGAFSTHEATYAMVRQASKECGKPICVLQDLCGPKIRIGEIEGNGAVKLGMGETIKITTDTMIGNREMIPSQYKDLIKDVKVGATIMIDDGTICMQVLDKNAENTVMTCKCVNGGVIRQKKGINVPGCFISAPPISEKDKKDLQFGLNLGVDAVCLSFVREAQDVEDLRNLMKDKEFNPSGRIIPIISKIERFEALENIEEILMVSDGIMIARGDMGVELPIHLLAVIQKRLIGLASIIGRIDITATQMLTSMEFNPTPTRGEVLDISNAIYDGTDVVMLSNETAVGQYPVETVAMMAKVAETADRSFKEFGKEIESDPAKVEELLNDLKAKNTLGEEIDQRLERADLYNAFVLASVSMAHKKYVKVIAILTKDGRAAVDLSQKKPLQPIVALTANESVCNFLQLAPGVIPKLVPETWVSTNKVSTIQTDVSKTLMEMGLVKKGEIYAFVQGNEDFGLNHGNSVRLIQVV